MTRPAAWAGRDARVDEAGVRGTGWWGVVLGIATLATAVGSVVSSYLYLRFAAPHWPPDGIGHPPLGAGLAASALAVASVVPAWLGARAIRRGRRGRLALGLAGALALGAAAAAVGVAGLADPGFSATEHAYGSLYFLALALAGALAGAGMLALAVVCARALAGHFGAAHDVPVRAAAIYWTFAVCAWLALWGCVGVLPRVLG